MSALAVKAENLGKRYRIGARQAAYRTFRETLSRAVAAPFRRLARPAESDREAPTVWALDDVSFEIARGEVVGVIGHNGAGKTTLLKILSRITEPTRGRVEIRGRVASLLEVGTGFHPELTGRENIYLNGAILGMRRTEIDRHFDAIVDFAEIERFLDTPVKRYSSGMYLRLAFAVAAHLDPEILLVDEILAVGDAAFQRKCLGQMDEVAREGRTVLMVSHNMAAIRSLCGRSMLLEGGRLVAQGPTDEVVSRYLAADGSGDEDLSERTLRGGSGGVRYTRLELVDGAGQHTDLFSCGDPLTIALDYRAKDGARDERRLFFHASVATAAGERLFLCSTRYAQNERLRFPASGSVRCRLPRLPLLPGQYVVDVSLKAGDEVLDHVRNAKRFTVVAGDFYGTGKLPTASAGPMVIEQAWHFD